MADLRTNSGSDTNQTVRKTLTFPAKLVELAEARGARFGMDFPEYLRYLLAQDAEEGVMISEMNLLEEAYDDSVGALDDSDESDDMPMSTDDFPTVKVEKAPGKDVELEEFLGGMAN